MTFPFPFHVYPEPKLINVIRSLGLTSNLRLVLDSTDSVSYTSGQKWLDVSGNGYDFFVGADSSATSTDPTFTGSAGTRSAYWAMDGGDFFRYDTTNETWMNNIHKNGAQYTIISWVYPIFGSNHVVLGNNGGTVGSGVGFHFGFQSDDKLFMRIANGGVGALGGTSTIGGNNGAWNFIGVSVNESATTGTYQINGTQQSFTSTYTSPSASSASFTTEVGARGNGSTPMPNGSRLSSVAAWEGVSLSQAQLDNIFQATRKTFGV